MTKRKRNSNKIQVAMSPPELEVPEQVVLLLEELLVRLLKTSI